MVLGYNNVMERSAKWNLKPIEALNLWCERSREKPAANSILRKESELF